MSLAEALASSSESLLALLDPYSSWLQDNFGWGTFESTAAMLFIFWFTVLLLVLVAINLYLKVVRRRNRILGENQQSEVPDGKVSTESADDSAAINEPIQTQRSASENFGEKPDDEIVEDYTAWMNNIIQWFYRRSATDPQFLNEMIDVVMTALNEKSAKNNDLFVEFTELDAKQCSPLNLVQVGEAEQINGSIIAKLKATCECLNIQIRVAPDRFADATKSAIYDVVLERFSIPIRSVCMAEDSALVIQALERPETKAQIGEPILGSKNKYRPDMVIDAVLNAFNTAIINLSLSHLKDFPRLKNQDGQTVITESRYPSKERKLLLKVIKAYDLDLDPQEDHEIYTMIELDEPFKSVKTSIVRENASRPLWDQHFMFNLNERSNEILFEVFDGSKINKANNNNDVILGNAIVNISELMRNPSQQQTLHLQSGVNKKDFGYLVVEFLLMEHNVNGSNHQTQQPRQTTITRQNSNPLSSSTGSASNQDEEELADYLLSGHDGGDGDHKNRPETQNQDGVESLKSFASERSSTASKSSLLISLQTDDIGPDIHDAQPVSPGNDNDSVEHGKSTPGGSSINSQNNRKQDYYGQEDGHQQQNGHGAAIEDNGLVLSSNQVAKKQTPSAPAAGKRTDSSASSRGSLFRDIKKRLSFKRRSKSVDRSHFVDKRENTPDIIHDDSVIDSRSAPGSREPSMPKETINGRRKQESFGDLSQASTRTFIHEDSVIIVECKERGVTQHFVAPNDLAAMKKLLKRRGTVTKMHLYKNHLFVARRMPLRKSCGVCGEMIPFHLGKQGYQCRDCNLACHKQCHVRVDETCQLSRISALNFQSVEAEPAGTLTRTPPILPELTFTCAEE